MSEKEKIIIKVPPTVRFGKPASSEVSSAALLSFDQFGRRAVECGIIQRAAWEDPAGYDNHRTVNALLMLYDIVFDNSEIKRPEDA